MKIKIDAQKGAEAASKFLQKTSDLGKKAISEVQAGAALLSEKAKQESYQRRLKKYNPLFPEAYQSIEFTLPNMIMIRDDAERRDIDVCAGAIGWLGNEGGTEVLYLYDEVVPSSGITFIPSADCNAIYYVDKFDRKKFVRIDCIFQNAHDERLAELEHIAYSLGAKHCTIDIAETEKSLKRANKRINGDQKAVVHLEEDSGKVMGEISTQFDSNYETTHKNEDKRCSELWWEGSDKPKKPKLKWFAHDDGIKGLIEMRFKGGNKVNTRSLKIRGSSATTMSKDTACRIDSAISCMGSMEGKKNTGQNAKFERQVTKETESIFIFNIEF